MQPTVLWPCSTDLCSMVWKRKLNEPNEFYLQSHAHLSTHTLTCQNGNQCGRNEAKDACLVANKTENEREKGVLILLHLNLVIWQYFFDKHPVMEQWILFIVPVCS